MVTTSGRISACWWAKKRPVRPMPDWISSTISSTPARLVRPPTSRSAPGCGTRIPASPWMGSTSTAAVSGPMAAARASTSPKGTWENPGGSGWNGVCIAGLPVAGRGGSVRAGNPPKGGPHPGRLLAPVGPAPAPGHLDGGLVGLGPGVGQEHLGVAAEMADEPFGQLDLGAGEVEVGGVAEGAELGDHRERDVGRGVAGRDHRDPAEEVQVLAAAGVPQPHPLAPDELDLGPHV